MAMVNQPAARRHHRSRIAYAFGLLALVGAAATVLVVVRDPALSSARLTTPVPAPEITVVDADPPPDDVGTGPEDIDAPFAFGEPDADATGTDEAPARGGPDDAARQEGGGTIEATHSPEDVRRSLFWSGIFGLAISLAGLGLVGTRRRMW
ncbi:hypothetical protein [Micromonospora deserti]|uniref:Uncharacterized protein n=1 Tax=Micromonospora deserti TaxID=2070366 RepID=A0A2W2CGV6_9ACTN|nr:hypothetical protein [Micromonospora deserti]PZF98635.1 hypothetical protein C1I99_13015 [Micromonospora deserti]